jgi:membrane protein required for colicin V production
MNVLDIILVIPILAFAIRGFQKGIFKQIFSLGGLVLACSLGFYANKAFIMDLWRDGDVEYFTANLLSILLIVLVVLILFLYIGSLLTKIFQGLKMGFLVRLLGLLFGVTKGLIISLLIAFVVEALALHVPEWQANVRTGSISLKYFQDINAVLLGYLFNEGKLEMPLNFAP